MTRPLHPDLLTSTWPAVVRAMVIVGTALLAWFAGRAGLEAPNANLWVVAIDVAVGIVFVGGPAFVHQVDDVVVSLAERLGATVR